VQSLEGRQMPQAASLIYTLVGADQMQAGVGELKTIRTVCDTDYAYALVILKKHAAQMFGFGHQILF
jgi:hypothetical protein